MNPEDREKVRTLFRQAYDINESLDAVLGRCGLTQEDVNRLAGSRLFQRYCRRMCRGMAARREMEIGRAGMEAAARITKYVANPDNPGGKFNELARKTYGDCIKLARGNEERDAEEQRERKRNPEERADAGVSRQLTKPERIAILRKMLEAAEVAKD